MIAGNLEAATKAVAPAVSGAAVDAEAEALHTLVLAHLDEEQAIETISIPLAGKSSIADYMVIASGRSTRHVAAIANKLAEKLKKEAGVLAKVEGLPAADWVLIDAGDIIIHLFRPEVRSFYNLERMWGFEDAPEAPPTAAEFNGPDLN